MIRYLPSIGFDETKGQTKDTDEGFPDLELYYRGCASATLGCRSEERKGVASRCAVRQGKASCSST